MDFEDTPEEAQFRAGVRAFLAKAEWRASIRHRKTHIPTLAYRQRGDLFATSVRPPQLPVSRPRSVASVNRAFCAGWLQDPGR